METRERLVFMREDRISLPSLRPKEVINMLYLGIDTVILFMAGVLATIITAMMAAFIPLSKEEGVLAVKVAMYVTIFMTGAYIAMCRVFGW